MQLSVSKHLVTQIYEYQSYGFEIFIQDLVRAFELLSIV